ncbi:hypothetical protein BV25DRAFT_1915237 [Artomyces pyxidatus]|uniref:Uncharacterized protein n=1 Tax=Artomyces pyxidatus TaxID=48021 RepID=A0ACB8T5B8_9AGAM|nr:hypothetical protein BV25DRAFT_1915237 [Artomyces pyxidatus]
MTATTQVPEHIIDLTLESDDEGLSDIEFVKVQISPSKARELKVSEDVSSEVEIVEGGQQVDTSPSKLRGWMNTIYEAQELTSQLKGRKSRKYRTEKDVTPRSQAKGDTLRSEVKTVSKMIPPTDCVQLDAWKVVCESDSDVEFLPAPPQAGPSNWPGKMRGLSEDGESARQLQDEELRQGEHEHAMQYEGNEPHLPDQGRVPPYCVPSAVEDGASSQLNGVINGIYPDASEIIKVDEIEGPAQAGPSDWADAFCSLSQDEAFARQLQEEDERFMMLENDNDTRKEDEELARLLAEQEEAQFSDLVKTVEQQEDGIVFSVVVDATTNTLEDGSPAHPDDLARFEPWRTRFEKCGHKVKKFHWFVNYELEKRFEHARETLELICGEPPRELEMFHGTGAQNIDSILKGGFRIGGTDGHPTVNGTALGIGIYLAADAITSLAYSQGSNRMKVPASVDVGDEMYDSFSQMHRSMGTNIPSVLVVRYTSLVLPCYMIEFDAPAVPMYAGMGGGMYGGVPYLRPPAMRGGVLAPFLPVAVPLPTYPPPAYPPPPAPPAPAGGARRMTPRTRSAKAQVTGTTVAPTPRAAAKAKAKGKGKGKGKAKAQAEDE